MERLQKQKAFITFLKNMNVGLGAKGFMLFSLFYLLWPIDILPDAIPLIGWSDDAGLLILALLLLRAAYAKQMKK